MSSNNDWVQHQSSLNTISLLFSLYPIMVSLQCTEFNSNWKLKVRMSPTKKPFFVVCLKQMWLMCLSRCVWSRNSSEGVAYEQKHYSSVLVWFHVHPGIIVRVERGDRGELGNCWLALFSDIVHLQDVLQECYTWGQRSSSALLSGGKPTPPMSMEV